MPAVTRNQMPPDAVKLKYAFTKLLGVEEADDDYKKSDIVLALQHAGVLGFEADFLGLATEDLLSLTMPGENMMVMIDNHFLL